MNRLASEVVEKKYSKGQTIIAEGDPGSSFYYIKEGEATAYKAGQFVRKLIKDDSFGEQSLLYNTIRQYTILADEETTTIILGRSKLHETMHKDLSLKTFNTFIKQAFLNNLILQTMDP